MVEIVYPFCFFLQFTNLLTKFIKLNSLNIFICPIDQSNPYDCAFLAIQKCNFEKFHQKWWDHLKSIYECYYMKRYFTMDDSIIEHLSKG